ncbi:MAG: hypothetical protein JW917_10280 [Ignavibacteria bacterium]|nr:hypothetical protein [Ignavibacteria bacterium]
MKQICLLTIVVLLISNVHAQHDDSSCNQWNFELALGIWNTAVRGDLTANSLPGYINVSLNDRFKNPDFSFIAGFEARKNKLALITEFVSMNQTGEGTFINSQYSHSRSVVRPVFVTAGLAFDCYNEGGLKLELFGGARLNYIRNEIETYFVSGGSQKEKEDRGFIDPVTGGRFLYKPFKSKILGKIFLKGYFDIGGFGLVSFLSSRSYLFTGIEFYKNFSLCLGYNYLDVNYGLDNFRYNAGIQGFELNAAARF